MSQSKTVEMLLNRRAALLKELAEVNLALQAIQSFPVYLNDFDYLDADFRAEERQKMLEEESNDLDDDPMHKIGYGRGDD